MKFEYYYAFDVFYYPTWRAGARGMRGVGFASERRRLAERAPLPPPEPRAHARGVVEVAALQREHELAPLHRLEADGARVVERLRERLPVAKLREPVRGGALLARDRHRDRDRVRA